MSYPEKTRSDAWFLLPIFLGLIGGIVAFFIFRQDDPRKARNAIYLVLVLFLRDILMIMMIAAQIPEIGSGFNVNM